MTAPAKQQAQTVLIFVGAASIALIIASISIRIFSTMTGIESSEMVEWLISIAVAFTGGGVGANEYRKRKQLDG